MNLNRGAGHQSSFLPEEYVKSKGQHRANLVALLLFGAVSVGTVGAFVYNYKRKVDLAYEVRQVRQQFDEEAAKIEQLRALEKQRVEILERAEVVTAIIDRVPRSVLMAEIVRSMPSGVALTEVNLDGERVKPAPKPKSDADAKKSVRGAKVVKKEEEPDAQKVLPPRFEHTITIDGLASLNNDVADFQTALMNSPLLAGVELQYINQTKIEETELRKFRITMRFKDGADVSRVADAHETTLIDEAAAFGVTAAEGVTE